MGKRHEELDARIDALAELIRVSRKAGQASEYQRGLTNGLTLAGAIIADSDPIYVQPEEVAPVETFEEGVEAGFALFEKIGYITLAVKNNWTIEEAKQFIGSFGEIYRIKQQ
jgi:hypothetical protein